MNKKGDFTGAIYLIVMVAALAFVILIAGYIGDTVTTEMKNTINTTNTEVNAAFDAGINLSNQTLSVVWFVVFGGLLLTLLVTSWFIPSQPVFVPIFAILLIITIMVGYAMSEAYTELYNVSQLSSIADTQTAVHFVMSNLAYIALVVGLLGLIITFAKPSGGTPLA